MPVPAFGARAAAAVASAALLASCAASPSPSSTMPSTAVSTTAARAPAAPAAAGADGAVEDIAVSVGAAQRRYLLFTPPRLEAARGAPLVLALHGGGNTAKSLAQATQLDRAARVHGFLVAYPEGVGRAWDGGFCCTGGRARGVDDVGFLLQVIEDVSARRNVARDRVYAFGVSNGAVMAYRLACERPQHVRGVGSVAGVMLPAACGPGAPVSVVEIHGTDDALVPFAGGRVRPDGVATQEAPSSRAVVEHWAARNRCSGAPSQRVEGLVTTTTWEGCAGGTRVRLVAVAGGDHVWFAPEFGGPAGAVDATAALVQFFGLGAGAP